jgi:DNA adenine methylase
MLNPEHIAPLIKIPGGKSDLAKVIVSLMPARITRYVEPFMGGAAVWCELVRQRRLSDAESVRLSDLDFWLVEAMSQVRDKPEALIAKLEALRATYMQPGKPEHVYYTVRDSWNRNVKSVTKRIFLSQSAFNGLWRENRQGYMNAPWNKRDTVSLPDPSKVRALSVALTGVELACMDFASALRPEDYGPGTVAYFDPPYLKTWNSYQAGGFSLENHARLLETCKALGKSGATVIYSNDASEQSRALVEKVWPEAKVDVVFSRRRINRDGDRRHEVPELLCSANTTRTLVSM